MFQYLTSNIVHIRGFQQQQVPNMQQIFTQSKQRQPLQQFLQGTSLLRKSKVDLGSEFGSDLGSETITKCVTELGRDD